MFTVSRDFSGSVEYCSQGNSVSAMSTAGSANTLLNYYYRQKALNDTVGEESFLLLINYPKLSSILNGCIRQLACYMGWDEHIELCCKGELSD